MTEQFELPTFIYEELDFMNKCYQTLVKEKFSKFPANLDEGMTLLVEEVGEIAKAINEYKWGGGSKEQIRSEIGDTTNVLICMLVLLDKITEIKFKVEE